MDLWHDSIKLFKRVIEKWSLQILICSLFQAKHLVITQEKDDGVKVVLSYRLQQNVSVELHMIYMLKQFPLQSGEAGAAASWFDIFNLDINDGEPAIATT